MSEIGREWQSPGAAPSATVEIVVPVYNEEVALPGCVDVLCRHLRAGFPYRWGITLADNASTDATWEVASAIAAETTGVRALHLDRKGRGLALRHVWTTSDADVLVYMDVDLSTDLGALLPLIAPLVSGHSDLAIGSRLAPGARTVRGLRRAVLSRCYNLLIRCTQGARFTDAQCGFKAGRGAVLRALLPHVEHDGWFFDTELLLLAEHHGLRVHEVPVDWVEDTDTRVRIVSTVLDDLRGLARFTVRRWTGLAVADGLARPGGAGRAFRGHLANIGRPAVDAQGRHRVR